MLWYMRQTLKNRRKRWILLFNLLLVSPDLLNWHYVKTLETNASQPTIAALPDGGFVLAYEKNTDETFYGRNFRGSSLALRYYANINNLLNGSSNKSISLKRTLSFSKEGTPNIYNFVLHPDIQHSVIVIGFHYMAHYPDNVDRQGIGTLQNFSFWDTEENANLNTLLTRVLPLLLAHAAALAGPFVFAHRNGALRQFQ